MILFKTSKYYDYIFFVLLFFFVAFVFYKKGLKGGLILSCMYVFFVILTLRTCNEVIVEDNNLIFIYNFMYFRKKSFDIRSISDIKLHQGTIREDFDLISFRSSNELITIKIGSKETAYMALKDFFDKNGIEYGEF